MNFNGSSQIMIRFGGTPYEHLPQEFGMHWFTTVDKTQWAIPLVNVTLGDLIRITSSNVKKALINPSSQYIVVPI